MSRLPRVLAWSAAAVMGAGALAGGMGPGASAAPASSSSTPSLSVAVSPGLPATASADPDKVSLRLVRKAGGLNRPVFVGSANDGVSRLFVVEQRGRIKIYKNGSIRARPYLKIGGRVNSSGSEQGLLGLAFSPTFRSDRHFWVSYVDAAGALQVSRFTAASPTARKAKRLSEVKVLKVKHPGQTNHNGGMLVFGRDGMLYISTGDGGGSGDPYANAQDKRSKSGKILRINPRKFCGTKKFCVPKSNPYSAPGGALGVIWAYGTRNVWRFSADRKTGDLWLADVGQDAYEEVTRVPYGKKGWNLGWSCREGRSIYNASRCSSSANYRDPTIVYGHGAGESITGGYVYRGTTYAKRLGGLYVFGDFVSGNLWVYGQGHRSRAGNVGAYRLSSFGESDRGELWAVTLDGGLYKVAASAG